MNLGRLVNRDWGILDRIYAEKEGKKKDFVDQIEHLEKICKNSRANWICFLPESNVRDNNPLRDVLCRVGNYDVYVLPNGLIQPTPKIIDEYLSRVLRMAIEVQEKKYSHDELNLMGVSLGNVLAYRLAAMNQFTVNRFISVVPGSRLSESIFEGIVTKSIPDQPLEKFKDVLGRWDPIENLDFVADKTELYVGTHDLMIPSKRGIELAKAVHSRKKLNPNINYFGQCGHVKSVQKFAESFEKRI